mmetsp:Transcript_44581/g.93293  ORF Transcript_44581/g.93293 Transcript_44581/m.93293 type:complete len:349 (-) Transcript_44581:431-1477(-)
MSSQIESCQMAPKKVLLQIKGITEAKLEKMSDGGAAESGSRRACRRPSKKSSAEEIQLWATQVLGMNQTDSAIISKHNIDGDCWASISIDQCLQIGMSFGSAVKFLEPRRLQQSYEDIQSLLQLLLLVAALLLSFALTLLTGSQTLEDLKTADARTIQRAIAINILDNQTGRDLKSVKICEYGIDALGYFTGVMITTSCLAVSFYLLPLKGSDSLFQIWWMLSKLPIIACFVGLLLGLQKLYAMNHNLIDAIYPIYDAAQSAASCYNASTREMIENFEANTSESHAYAFKVGLIVSNSFIWIPCTICGSSLVLWVTWVFVYPTSSFLQEVAEFSVVEYLSGSLRKNNQ